MSDFGQDCDPAAPYAAALSGLPKMGPATLFSLLSRSSPDEVWRQVRSGELRGPEDAGGAAERSGQLAWGLSEGAHGSRPASRTRSSRASATWSEIARRLDPPTWWERAAGRAIGVTWAGQDTWPAALAGDPHPPGVLFWRGSIGCLGRPCVAIVGTRSATPDGRAVAFEMGRDLSAAGVCVVSGLALGIDGAAHAGALSAVGHSDGAGPVGVAASGVDVPYPRQHADLWRRVASAGAILSETLPGRPAEAWRFPARNRVIAGLVRMVVIVESHSKGGSLITAEAAIDRGLDVRVVPGPVHSPASAGSNQLLYDGAGPVRSARDVLDGLGILLPDPAGSGSGATGGPTVRAGDLDPAGLAVLAAIGWRPASLNQIMERSGVCAGDAAKALQKLEATGLASLTGGWWARTSRSFARGR
ncbi:MAG: DNA-processing protein DprA [Acidimicrobiales bacterium]